MGMAMSELPRDRSLDEEPSKGRDGLSSHRERLLDLLRAAIERDASDLHLVPGYPPTLRVHGKMQPTGDDPLQVHEVRRMVEHMLPERLRGRLGERKDYDCSVPLAHNGRQHRFRANIYLSHSQWCACLRHIPGEVPSLDWLGFPRDLAERLVGYGNGLVIITGAVGSGKSTTLAALIHLLRQDAHKRAITVEEPIEYAHQPGRGGMVTQREVGRDVDSFAEGLKYGLRQDPDVLAVGEIRDRITAQMVLSAAETGHLILSTMHTRDAKGALTRFVDLFPSEVHDDVRRQLAMSLRSVVTQFLLPPADEGEKRVLALEVLHANMPAQIAIRLGRIETVESVIQTGKSKGMILLDDDLQRLVLEGKINHETARRLAKDPSSLTPRPRRW